MAKNHRKANVLAALTSLFLTYGYLLATGKLQDWFVYWACYVLKVVYNWP